MQESPPKKNHTNALLTGETLRLTGDVSKPMSARPRTRTENRSTWSGFLLLVTVILTSPNLRTVFRGIGLWTKGQEGSTKLINGIGVQAEMCSSVGIQSVTVSNEMSSNLSTIFDCDEGEFHVSWVGVVNVSSTIKIGSGTTVRIFGETTVAAPSADSSSNTASILTVSSSSSNTRSTSTKISGVDLDLELEILSNGLNLPQGLTSAAVGFIGPGADNALEGPFGPIFFVNDGELFLQSLAVRRGSSTNSEDENGFGGGVHAINSNVSVSGCELEDNFSEKLGGGIYARGSTLTVTDSVFRGNHAGSQSVAGQEDGADSNGGGIMVSSLTSLLELSRLFFTERIYQLLENIFLQRIEVDA